MNTTKTLVRGFLATLIIIGLARTAVADTPTRTFRLGTLYFGANSTTPKSQNHEEIGRLTTEINQFF